MKIFQLNIPNSRTIKFQLYRRTKNDFHDSHYKLKTFPKLDSQTPSKRSNTKSIHRHKKHKKKPKESTTHFNDRGRSRHATFLFRFICVAKLVLWVVSHMGRAGPVPAPN